MKSPLTEISNILQQTIAASEAYKSVLQQNEAATRAVLIDPILRILGWEISNPFMVEVEKYVEQSKFDYALLDPDQDVVILVEAKKLGSDLSDRATFLSLVKYAYTLGKPNILLTDGIIWRHYVISGPENDKPERIFSLKDDNLIDVASYLVQTLDAAKFWENEDNLLEISREVRQLRGELDSLKARLDKQKIEPNIQGPVNAETPDGFLLMSDDLKVRNTKPTRLKLPDGTIIDVRNWSDVLFQCSMYVVKNVEILPIPYKDVAGRKVELFSRNRPPENINYKEIIHQNALFFVYTNYEAAKSVANSLHVLSLLPSSLPRQAYVEFS